MPQKKFDIQERTYSCFWHRNFDAETKKEIMSRTIEHITDKLKEHYRFKYYIKDNDYTKLIDHLYRNNYYYTFSRLLEMFSEFGAADLFLSNIEYEIIQYLDKLTEDDISIIMDINEEIERQLKTYGRHEELVEKRSTIIMWSNKCVCWNIVHLKIKKGDTIKLDASMVLVPYPKSKVRKYLCLLNESPLYKYSYEAVYERGEVPFIEGVLGWMDMVISTETYRKMREERA
jgi:hypothetical protein